MRSTVTADEARRQIEELLAQGAAATPARQEPDLRPSELTAGEPEWYSFERRIWETGDRIRRVLDLRRTLRGDPVLGGGYLRIIEDRRAKRGRQSFVMLFAYKSCAPFAARLATHIDDDEISGHVIDALLKMRVTGFACAIRRFETHRHAWIRAKAKMYCSRYGR